MDKEYIGEFVIGASTPSFDLEKEISEFQKLETLSAERVKEVFEDFIGEQEQIWHQDLSPNFGSGVSLADVNQDGWDDITLLRGQNGQRQQCNRKQVPVQRSHQRDRWSCSQDQGIPRTSTSGLHCGPDRQQQQRIQQQRGEGVVRNGAGLDITGGANDFGGNPHQQSLQHRVLNVIGAIES